MRIGIITHNYPRYPGDFSGTFMQQLCQELAKQGEEVHVIAPFDPAYDRESLAGENPRLHLYRYAWPEGAHRLGYMRTMQADVRMRLGTYVLSPLMFWQGTRAIDRVSVQHQLEVLHAHWALPNGYMASVVSRRRGIPLVVSIPGSDALVADQNALFRRMARQTFDQASLITANSRSLQKVAVGRLGADPRKFELVIYAVDPDKYVPSLEGTSELRQRLGIPDQAFVFLAVGRMVYKKGFDVLLQSLAWLGAKRVETAPDLPEFHTVLVGEGDLWQLWQQQARELGLDHVHWPGNVPTDEMAIYYNMADALVMPNVTRPATGLGVTVLDAMACGKAIIGSDTAGNPLVIEPDLNGFIVPEGDAQQLAEAMWTLLNDPDLAKEMGKASRELIETRYGWPHIAHHYRRRYHALKDGRLQLDTVE